jgi:hypothetical protein
MLAIRVIAPVFLDGSAEQVAHDKAALGTGH